MRLNSQIFAAALRANPKSAHFQSIETSKNTANRRADIPLAPGYQ